MSDALRVLENRELKPGISCQVVHDTSKSRVYFNVSNQRRVEVEVRFDWTQLENLRALSVYDFMNYKLFETSGTESGADSTSLSYSNLLDRTDGLGRTRLKPNDDILCAVLEVQDKAQAHAFSYSYTFLATETLSMLPPVTRVIESTEIRPGVFVRALWYGSLRQMRLNIHNERDTHMRLKLVWSAFDNMRVLVGASGEAFIPANSDITYAVLSPASRAKPWRYRYSFRVVTGEIHPPSVVEEANAAKQDVAAHLAAFSQAVCYSTNCQLLDVPVVAAGMDDETIQSMCETHKCGFVDVVFPPTLPSLAVVPHDNVYVSNFYKLDDDTKVRLSVPVRARGAVWKKLGDLLGNNATVLGNMSSGIPNVAEKPEDSESNSLGNFSSEISPACVRPGTMDAWFSGTIAALAERPELISRCFLSKTLSRHNRYSLSLLDPVGIRSEVVIDDYIPILPLTGTFFTRGHGNVMWPALLHKAYAKMMGSYAHTVSGQPHLVFNTLTGCPVDTLPLRAAGRSTDLWDSLCRYTQQGYIMCAVSDRCDPVSTGLKPKSVYTVLGCLPQQRPGDPRLLILRAAHDPTAQWIGQWAHGDPNWENEHFSEIRNLAPVEQVLSSPDSGEFFMSLEDFTSQFRTLSVCFFRKEWQEIRIPFSLIPKSKHLQLTQTMSEKIFQTQTSSFLVDIQTETHLFAALHQTQHYIPDEKPYILRPGTSGNSDKKSNGVGAGMGADMAVHSGILICSTKIRPGVDISSPPTDIHGNVDVAATYEIDEVIGDSSALCQSYLHAECGKVTPGTYIIVTYTLSPPMLAPAITSTSTASTPISTSDFPASEATATTTAPATLALHATCPMQVLLFPSVETLTQQAILTSIKKHAVAVTCNVPGLILYDWCAKKSAFFAVEMTPAFVQATGRNSIIFKHEVTLSENVQPICGKNTQISLKVGEMVLLNIATVIQVHKAWRYKHKWEFTYVEEV